MIEYSGLNEARNVLTYFSNKLQTDTSPLMSNIGSLVASQTEHRFETNIDPFGIHWQPISQKTANQKGGKLRNSNGKTIGYKPKHDILVDQGHLLDSITFNASNASVEIGSYLRYAPTQQFGDKSRNIPARPFLGISNNNFNEIEEACQDWLGDLINSSGVNL